MLERPGERDEAPIGRGSRDSAQDPHVRDVDDADALVPTAAEGDPLARRRKHWAPDAAGQLDDAPIERPEGGGIEPPEACAAVPLLDQRQQGGAAGTRRPDCMSRLPPTATTCQY